MVNPILIEYAANAHREDLLREARQAALAAEATDATGGWWDRAFRLAAYVLLWSGHRLNAYLCDRRLGRTTVASHSATHAVCSRHQPHTALCCVGYQRVAARRAVVPGQSGGHSYA
jgi:hypothetical protein